MRPVLYENEGVGYFRGNEIYFMAKKNTLTIFHFGMNAAVLSKAIKPCKGITLDSQKDWHHGVPLKMTLWNHKMTLNLNILDYFP